MMFALISTTKLVSASDLYRLGQALERQVMQVSSAWMIDDPVAVVVCDVERKLPSTAIPIVLVDDENVDGTLGYHFFDPLRGGKPAARVFVEKTSGLNAGPYSVSEVASHEVLEALINPQLAVWFQHVGRAPGIESPCEICDATQDDYTIRANNTPWKVSNFLTPQYWQAAYADPTRVQKLIRAEGYGVDWCGRMERAGEILSTGYSVFRERRDGKSVRTWSEDRDGMMSAASRKLDRKKHPASRTNKLGGVPK